VEPARLSSCQQSKKGISRFLGLLYNDYYLQKAIEAVENPQLTWRVPRTPACNQETQPRISGRGEKLQVDILPGDAFDGVGDLAV
jgi:hypothetical protein